MHCFQMIPDSLMNLKDRSSEECNEYQPTKFQYFLRMNNNERKNISWCYCRVFHINSVLMVSPIWIHRKVKRTMYLIPKKNKMQYTRKIRGFLFFFYHVIPIDLNIKRKFQQQRKQRQVSHLHSQSIKMKI